MVCLTAYNNFETRIEDSVLTIKVLLDESRVDVKPSASGKSVVVATTGGAVRVNGGPYKLTLTVFRKL